MSVHTSPFARALGISALLTSAAGAQAQKACEVNESRPREVGRATLAVQVASSSNNAEAAKRQLLSAMKLLTTNGDKMENPAGRNFVVGKALVLWSMQPAIGNSVKRSTIGIVDDPEGTLDFAAAIDSSFKITEKEMPECISETMRWRGQKPWVDLVNKAIEKLNIDDVDSAEVAAQRAITLNPYAPYGFVVLANVKQRRNKHSEAFALYRRSVELAAKDTSYDDIRRQSLVYLGGLAVDSAEMVSDTTARKPYLEEARASFEAILADKDASENHAHARSGMCRVAIVTGDTASLRKTYKDPIANPSSFAYADLMAAGVCLARAEMPREATAVFQTAYEKNPYHRDVLSNLAIVLLRQDLHERSLPLSQRLVSVEPNNQENLQLLVLGYAGIATRVRNQRVPPRPTQPATKTGAKQGTKAPAARPAPAPRLPAAVADSLFKLEQAYTDSAVKANERKEALTVRVSLSDFSATKTDATLAGSMTLTSTGAAGEYTIKIDFLDEKGATMAAQETKVSVTAETTGRFRVKGTGAGITAFRYSVSK